MKKELLNNILNENKNLQALIKVIDYNYSGINLVGGAVIDILEGRTPKDYDIITGGYDSLGEKLVTQGHKYLYESSTAETYKVDDMIVQILKTKVENFDFKISQASYSLHTKKLDIDFISFATKSLRPVSFDSPKAAINSLRRIPHWQKKGYKITDEAYMSLLNIATKYKYINCS